MTTRIEDNLRVEGNLVVDGTLPTYTRGDLSQESAAVYPLPFDRFRVWDARNSLLGATASGDDLGLVTGTLGTDSPTLETGDLKNAGATTMYAAVQAELPVEYVDGETVTVRISAGMKTTVASVSATVDVEAYKVDREAGVGTDLCTTAAQSINDDLVLSDYDFTLTPTGLSPGDLLDIRIAVAVNDSGTGTAVIGQIGQVELLCDIKG